ncbi:MAG: hypothetical protein Q8918_04955 [Bacteroidota bacterium]|nr:hypothetical protein [Bacteroidota bacterium]MDP4211157.1 hypothetical protein [Bacteroidota bacterium]MDP4249444.1 hypothetical protein [Bacteroidota bacterium]
MKKTIWLTCFLFGLLGLSFGQSSIEFIPMAGYTFPEKLNFNDSYGRLGDAINLGGSFQFNFNRHFGLELMYDRVDATAKMYDYGSPINRAPFYQTQAGINYIMLGPVSTVQVPGSPVHLFFGVLLGAAVYTPGPDDLSSNAGLAWGLQTGANIYFTRRVGLRISARLLSGTAPDQGSGYYLGSFGESHNGYYSNPSIYQFGLNAGLIIGLGHALPEYRRTERQRRHAPRPRRYYYY